jgi:hypothetical protein
MHRKLTALIGTLALVGLATACSSSSTTTTSSPTTTTGTETFTSGTVTNTKILESNSPNLPLTWAGVVATTSTENLGGSGPTKGQEHTFKTGKGNLVVEVTANPTNTNKFVDAKTCLAREVSTIPFTVIGGKSTGSWKGASGSGVVNVTFQGNSELKGKCSLANNAEPTTLAGAYILFTGTGRMTVVKS